jgi:hypothetical protein
MVIEELKIFNSGLKSFVEQTGKQSATGFVFSLTGHGAL